MSVPGIGSPREPQHSRNDSLLSIGSDLQAGNADTDFKAGDAFKDVLTQVVRTSVSEVHRIHRPIVARPIMGSTRPDITAQLRARGWNQACEDYFSGQSLDIDQEFKDDAHEDRVADPKVKEASRDELCCKLLEAAIAQPNLLAFMIIPIPKAKMDDLVACLDAFIGDNPEPEGVYQSMKTALTSAGSKSKAEAVLGIDD